MELSEVFYDEKWLGEYVLDDYVREAELIRAKLEQEQRKTPVMCRLTPGNGTEYRMLFAHLTAEAGWSFGITPDGVTRPLLVAMPSFSAAQVFADKPGFRHWTYVKEKLSGGTQLAEGDAKPLANLLNALLGVA